MMKKLDTNIIQELLGLPCVKVEEIFLRDNRELLIKVKSTQEETLCRNCGATCQSHGYDRAMEMRHLSILGYKTFIELTPKRGICKECSDKSITTTQTLDWYDRNAKQTKPYEQHILFELINATVADVSRNEEGDEHTIGNLRINMLKLRLISVLYFSWEFLELMKLVYLRVDRTTLR